MSELALDQSIIERDHYNATAMMRFYIISIVLEGNDIIDIIISDWIIQENVCVNHVMIKGIIVRPRSRRGIMEVVTSIINSMSMHSRAYTYVHTYL